MRKLIQKISPDIGDDIPYVVCSMILFALIFCCDNILFLIFTVAALDIYWFLALINAALRSREANPKGLFAFPSRVVGLLFFVSCFSYEVYSFGQWHYVLRDGFVEQDSRKTLEDKQDAYYLSLGTVTAVTIVNYSAVTPEAKVARMSQAVSNLVMFFSILPILIARFSSFKDKPRKGVINGEKLEPYNPSFNDKVFNAAGIEILSGLSPSSWCELSGLFGLKKALVEKEDFALNGSYPTLNLTVNQSDKSIYIQMSFDLETRCITIKDFAMPNNYSHYSSKIWKSITDLAEQGGFQEITIQASATVASGSSQICLAWEKESNIEVTKEIAS